MNRIYVFITLVFGICLFFYFHGRKEQPAENEGNAGVEIQKRADDEEAFVSAPGVPVSGEDNESLIKEKDGPDGTGNDEEEDLEDLEDSDEKRLVKYEDRVKANRERLTWLIEKMRGKSGELEHETLSEKDRVEYELAIQAHEESRDRYGSLKDEIENRTWSCSLKTTNEEICDLSNLPALSGGLSKESV